MSGPRIAPHDGRRYIGRFAPSPTGPLHAGSLAAALASWLDARAHDGRWLVRIEDIDRPRCVPGADRFILQQLETAGLVPDEAPMWQSTRDAAYEAALDKLVDARLAYPCSCTRRELQAAAGAARERHSELIYPGTCRPENGGLSGRPPRSMRLRVSPPGSDTQVISWVDRRLGPQSQDVARAVGDFVLRRADGLWAYQLAVVVDDAEQGITAVVRGEDLADNTARQILLQQLLGHARPSYCHTPLVRDGNGEKLSKQHGAVAVDLSDPASALRTAAGVLGIAPEGVTPADVLASGVAQWRAVLQGTPPSTPNKDSTTS